MTRLAEVLQSRGVPKQNIVLLTNSRGADDPRYLPTGANIRRELDLLLSPRASEDVIIVAFAGHGVEPPNKPYFFCPYDADLNTTDSLIAIDSPTGDSVYKQLRGCKSNFKLLFVDACRERTLAPAARTLTKPENLPKSVTLPALTDPPGGTAAFFSCSAGQVARERVDDGPNGTEVHHGLFFHAVIDGLSGKAADATGEITVPDLEKYVKRQVQTYARVTYSAKQYPDVRNQTRGLLPLLPPITVNFAGSRAGEEWSGNGLGIRFCWCPAGSFTMGSPEDEPDRDDDEAQVRVTLSRGFWLGKYEVTQSEWERVMGSNPSYFASTGDGKEKVTGRNTSRFPVEQVSWEDAMSFCRKLTSQERSAGRLPSDWEFTLPTESQWEYGCRAGTTTATAFGATLSSREANFDGNYPYNGASNGPYLARTTTVGSYKANAWGLFDLHGNIYEWCRDSYGEKLPGGRDPFVDEAGRGRLYRGGCWYLSGRICRSANRHVSTRKSSFPELGWMPRPYNLGFRLASVQSR